MRRVQSLQMVTPFQSDIAELDRDAQVVLLKGCALCQITRQVDAGSTRNKPEWKSCKAELGVPVEVFALDQASAALLDVIDHRAPAVCALADDGEVLLLLDQEALARCRGSVQDFRGRLAYRLAMLDLSLEGG